MLSDLLRRGTKKKTVPEYVGTIAFSTETFTLPTGTKKDDLIVYARVESASSFANPLENGNGWTKIDYVTAGGGGDSISTRMDVYWRFVTAADELAGTMKGPNGNCWGVVMSVRGIKPVSPIVASTRRGFWGATTANVGAYTISGAHNVKENDFLLVFVTRSSISNAWYISPSADVTAKPSATTVQGQARKVQPWVKVYTQDEASTTGRTISYSGSSSNETGIGFYLSLNGA